MLPLPVNQVRREDKQQDVLQVNSQEEEKKDVKRTVGEKGGGGEKEEQEKEGWMRRRRWRYGEGEDEKMEAVGGGDTEKVKWRLR